MECVGRAAYDRLAAQVEARVDQHRTLALCIKCGEEPMKAGIGGFVNGLDPGRKIDVGDGREMAFGGMQLIAELAPRII